MTKVVKIKPALRPQKIKPKIVVQYSLDKLSYQNETRSSFIFEYIKNFPTLTILEDSLNSLIKELLPYWSSKLQFLDESSLNKKDVIRFLVYKIFFECVKNQ